MNLFFFWLSDGHVVGGTPEKKKVIIIMIKMKCRTVRKCFQKGEHSHRSTHKRKAAIK